MANDGVGHTLLYIHAYTHTPGHRLSGNISLISVSLCFQKFLFFISGIIKAFICLSILSNL